MPPVEREPGIAERSGELVELGKSDTETLRLPGLDLHQLKGDRKGTWAVKASGNWRVTFTFVGKDADDVDYEDYH